MNLFDSFARGMEIGTAQRKERESAEKQSKLASLYSTGLGGGTSQQQSTVQQLAAIDPKFAIDAQKSFDGINDDRETNLLKGAKMILAMPESMRPQAYAKFRQDGQHFGYQLPEEYSPEVEQMATQLVASTQEKMKGVVVGGALVDPYTGKELYKSERQQNRQIVQGADGAYYSIDPMTGAAEPVVLGAGGQPQQLPSQDGQPAPQQSGDFDWGSLFQRQEKQESGGNQNAVSPKGAFGVMQIMPATARDPGFGMAPLRPGAGEAENRAFGQEYMKRITHAMGGDIRAGLMAYNWGIGNAKNAIARHGSVDAALANAPAETKQYVRNILGGGVQVADNRGSRGVAPRATGQPLMGAPKGAMTQAQMEDRDWRRERASVEDQRWGITNARAEVEARRKEEEARSKSSESKPMPMAAVKEDLAIDEVIAGAKSTADMISKHVGRFQRGEVSFDPLSRGLASVASATGTGRIKTANYTEFKADLQKMVNDSLRLNKGVQTEGDAQRAVKELMGANDNVTVMRAMKRLADINKQAAQLQQRKRQTLYSNYGRSTAPANSGGGASRGTNQSDADLLKKYGL